MSKSLGYGEVQDAVEAIRKQSDMVPELAVILGTGMGQLAAEMQNSRVISYETIPHFPVSTVESHAGKLHLGDFYGMKTVMMQGRFHFYEGYSMQQIAFPIRVMKGLGARNLLVMNAVGSVNKLIPAGSLVMVQDHINLMGDNPLIGANDERFGTRFPDMSDPYNKALRALMEKAALSARIPNVYKGVLVAVTGPCFETAAEYRMFQRMGADIVGMSTIPEVIAAVHCGLKSVCISSVTDECYPDSLEPVDLPRILNTVSELEPRLRLLVSEFVKALAASENPA